MKYLKRIADDQLRLRLEAFGAVQIKGPKWCGKTTTAEMQGKECDKNAGPGYQGGLLGCRTYQAFSFVKG